MKSLLTIISAFLLSTLITEATDTISLFAKGNEFFINKDYPQAIEQYEKALETGVSSNIYSNLGNAYQKTGQIGLAVLNYEKALTINPSNPEAKINLRLIREEHQLQSPDYSYYDGLVDIFALQTWIWIACISFWIIVFSIVIKMLYKNNTIVITLTRFAFIILFSLSISSLVVLHYKSNNAVIIQASTPLLVAPASNSDVDSYLNAGDIVSQEEVYKEFTKIKTLQNKLGWTKNEHIRIIWK